MLHDTCPHIRKLSLRRILNAKTKGNSSTNIRLLVIQQINFDADDYVDLIDWQKISLLFYIKKMFNNLWLLLNFIKILSLSI